MCVRNDIDTSSYDKTGFHLKRGSDVLASVYSVCDRTYN